ncbi:MAG: hypothetical protein CR982_06465 [Candidatus Cloacimonadota bacterium]|nr:MAG: hypothetical protein CR982_06465 [Candidatus Cloacimonadota bacterium]PIE77927.1 MAG: hypothetical protein CSA15_10570 [Candidatus Delongbacteria bacterium]
MAVIKKFKAIRPKEGLEKAVASFPYDVINSEEAREIAKGNPHSFLHVVKPEIDLPVGTDLYSEEVYATAKANIEKFISEGTLIQDEEPKLYIYRQTMDGREQYGIVGSAFVDDYDNDVIKKHEHTRKKKEADRVKHVDTTNINAGPIFLTYKNKESINNIVSDVVKSTKPVYDFVADDGIGHTVWIIEDDSKSDKLIEEFAKIDYLYVADGHHRSASAAIVANRRRENNPNHNGSEEYNYFLAVYFPDEQLHIMDYNRVVIDLNGNSEDEYFEKLTKIFECEKIGSDIYRPTKKGEIGMYMDKNWYKLTVKSGIFDPKDPVNSLDTAILQSNILDPVLGIDDPRTSERVDFIGGIRGLEELVKLVDSGKFKVAFAMYPTSIKELMDIADAGKVMAPKSTWFEPKLRSGLLIHSLND